MLDEFYAWIESLNAIPKTGIGKAAHYTLTQRKYLERYLLDGRLEISNNRAERSIKPFVIDRNYVPSIFMCHRETKHIEMHRFPWKGQLINESSQ